MTAQQVIVLDRDSSVGAWLLHQLEEISVPARWVATVGDLIDLAERQSPTVCLVALRAPVAQVLSLITNLSQEPRFARTAFILMGPAQYKHSAFEAGAHDYLITPPDVIELRKRVRLYLDRAHLEDRAAGAGDSAEGRSHPAWELLARYTPVALALLHPDGSLIQANPAWEALAVADVGPVWPLAGETALVAAMQQGTAWQGYTRGVRRDGQPWVRQVTLTPLHGSGEQLTGFVVTQADLSEYSASTDMAGMCSSEDIFEMRSALSSLKLRQHIMARATPDQQAGHLAILEHETDRLAEIVERMVTMLRLDQGLTHMTFKTLSLGHLAAEVLNRHSHTAASQGITLSLAPGDTPLFVLGDSAHLSRALGTLVENALRHTPHGGRVTVSILLSTTTEGQLAAVQVEDTGEGIAQEELPFIFERHYRGARASAPGENDQGLRLAAVKEIITRHNGMITVKSAPGQGSTFTIWLPANASGE